jgi:hypothetical protein
MSPTVKEDGPAGIAVMASACHARRPVCGPNRDISADEGALPPGAPSTSTPHLVTHPSDGLRSA